MKCPKCRYIGFETGDRCRNCGYDFSLLSDPALSLEATPETGVPDLALQQTVPEADREPMDLSLHSPEDVADKPPVAASLLPLFRDARQAEDEPLVRMAAPRPPIAVRKTPDAQRMRFTPIEVDRSAHDAVFEFGAEPEPESDPVMEIRQSWGLGEPPVIRLPVVAAVEEIPSDTSPLGSRLAAALIDYALLFGIDAVVIHFTLKLTSLTLADWRVIPATPLLIFLVGLKLAYLTAFTLAGGQTIGKMAMGIRVVAEDDNSVDVSQAVRRAIVEVVSLVAAGVPFLLALLDPARRGLHDRVAHTRVVAH